MGCSMRIVISKFSQSLKLAVIAFFQGVVEIGGGVGFAVVPDFLIAARFDKTAVGELEAIARILQIRLLHQHALESFRVEAERGAAFQALLPGITINVLEVFEWIVGGYVGSF